MTKYLSNTLALITISLILWLIGIVYGLSFDHSKGVFYYTIFGILSLFFGFSLLKLFYEELKEIIKDLKQRKDPLATLYDMFASLKLAFFLMIAIAIFSMFGSTYIEQEQPLSYYINKYGENEAHIIMSIHLNNIFHSWYYRLLLYLFGINLIVCSIKRLPPIWRHTFGKERITKLDEKAEKHLKPISTKFTKDIMDLAKFLKAEGFKVFYEEDSNAKYIYAEKGKWARLGVYIVHIGLIVLLSGALIDSYLGIRGIMQVPEGTKSNTLLSLNIASNKTYELPFYIYEKQFKIITYGKSSPEFASAVKSYQSYIYIIKDNRIVDKGSLAVNSPFDYKGYNIYQASYGLTGFPKEMKLLAIDKKKAIAGNPKKALVGEVQFINSRFALFNGIDLKIEKSTLNIENPQAGMNGDLKPAVILKASYNGKDYNIPVIYSPQLTLLAYNEMPNLKDFPYVFFMESFDPQYFSGFQVSKNPGTNIIWLGSIITILGMMLAFYKINRKVWMRLEGENLKIAIYSHKFKEDFQKTFLQKLKAMV